jgi:4-amino-4-deoxy-L-arabinose transferase-like glycosyltransferase
MVRRREAGYLLGILLLALLPRVVALDQEELWLDEARTFGIASLALSEVSETLPHSNKPPLYYLVIRGWMVVFGSGESALRSLSVLFGVLTVCLLFYFGRDLGGPSVGWIAAGFAALSPLAILYSREARSYSVAAFLVLLAMWFFHRATAMPSRRRYWLGHALSVAGCMYTHYVAGLVILVSATLVFFDRRAATRKGWILATSIALALFSPWIPVLLVQISEARTYLEWVIPFWKTYPPLLAVPRSLLAFMPGGAVPPFVGLQTLGGLQPAIIGTGLLLMVLLLWPKRHRWVHEIPRPALSLSVALCFIPLLLEFVISFQSPIYMVGRSDFIAFPGFCLLVALVTARLRFRALRILTGTVLASFAVAALWAYDTAPPRQNEGPVFRALSIRVNSEDLVVCTDLTRPTAEYYLKRFCGDRVPDLVSYPAEMALHPASLNYTAYEGQRETLVRDAEIIVARVDAVMAEDRSVFMLWVETAMNLPLRQALQRRYQLRPLEPIPSYSMNQINIPVGVGSLVRVFEEKPTAPR